jgi:ketosteroid isomerase-like protein
MTGATDHLRDRAVLTDVISRYAHAVDNRDVPGIVACFTADAHIEFGGGADVAAGRQAIARFFEDALFRPMMGANGASTHLMTDVLVSVDGDTAHVETQAVAYLAAEGRDTVIVRGLRYSDDCIRDGEGWLIDRRMHRAIWQYEAPGGLVGIS